ncbi:MAG: Stp1/IreP family PP2C-type Ser/Thr phosphatase [Burkholderiaceae bacterium]|jgi:protein phosphatase|nr:Stp1/IreP family PP2C-type Ser/Thr phosphatase [Burkholderiaceae bacterium]
MKYEYFTLTHVGQVRENNEDAIGVDAAHGIAVLADGMGGYNAGEVASALAVNLVTSEMARWLQQTGGMVLPGDALHAMKENVNVANQAIFEAACMHSAYEGMGTTLVMLMQFGERMLIGHVGDSRAYRLRDGTLTQLTRDHSVLQEQLDMGLITPEEAATMQRNLITRAMGVEYAVELEVKELQAWPGDLYLLCSDGLTDMLSDADILDALQKEDGDLPRQASALIELANARGGRDNISVALIAASEGAPGAWSLARAHKAVS